MYAPVFQEMRGQVDLKAFFFLEEAVLQKTRRSLHESRREHV